MKFEQIVEKVKDTYPVLKQNRITKTIVLFVKPRSGFVVSEGDVDLDAVGEFKDNWSEDRFEDIVHGTLTF